MINLNKKAKISVFEIILLIFSTFAIGYFLSEGFVFVSAEEKWDELLIAGSYEPIEVQYHPADGSFSDRYGRIYYADDDGNLVHKQVAYASVSPDSVTATQNPTSTPTGIPAVGGPGGYGGTGVGATPGAGGGAAGALQAMSGSVGQMGGLLKGPLGEALVWGGVMFGAGMAVASVLGGKQEMVEAVSIAAGVGAFTAKMAQGYLGTSTFTSILIGVGVGVLVFYLIYKETKYESVTFTCMPWQAPIGATKEICETCNEEGRPCSEYRCKSLGQTCELVNEGKKEEMCVNVNPKDVIPPIITPDNNELSAGYKYINVKSSPPGPGFDIVRMDGENECVEAFTPLRFGISTNEPAECKIDFNSTTSFDSMRSFMGNSNLYKYNHYEQFVLPHKEDFGNTSYQLINGQDLTFFIRCRDKRGNTNEAEYAVNFCIDPSPDTTAPRIRLTSMEDGGCIPATTDSAIVEFYVNEPSNCRWSRFDQAYGLMEHDMNCATDLFQMNALQLYTCQANLTGVTRDLTSFYVRCEDQQDEPENDRNSNQESLKFSLRGSNQLKLRRVGPNGTIEGGVDPLPIDLKVETLFGCEKGRANCYFSPTNNEGDYILFASTDTEDGIHNQTLFLQGGQHEYFIKCVDSGGNLVVNSTKFFLDIDTSSPIIARIYNDVGQLKIVTLRESVCSFSYDNCDFMFEEGISMPKDDSKVHFAPWNNEKTYYIKCRDKYRDLTADCSAIVKPTKLFYE